MLKPRLTLAPILKIGVATAGMYCFLLIGSPMRGVGALIGQVLFGGFVYLLLLGLLNPKYMKAVANLITAWRR